MSDPHEIDLLERWTRSGYPRDVGASLLARYREPHRHYHTADHLHFMFDLLDNEPTIRAEFERLIPLDRKCVELAVWYHDCIYVPRQSDNELQSALRLVDDARALNLTEYECRRAASMVLESARHTPRRHDPAAALFCDLDLAILSAPADDYERYRRGVREEYGHLSDLKFTWGRRRVLASILRRDRLFQVLRAGEVAARMNIRAELQQLGYGESIRTSLRNWRRLSFWKRAGSILTVVRFLGKGIAMLARALLTRSHDDSTNTGNSVLESRLAHVYATSSEQPVATRAAGRFVVIPGGLRIEEKEGVFDIPWPEIQRVFAFKEDCFVVDRICLALETNARVIVVTEDDPRFEWLTHEFPSHLEGMLPFEQWFFTVAFPAFVTNETILYIRSAP